LLRPQGLMLQLGSRTVSVPPQGLMLQLVQSSRIPPNTVIETGRTGLRRHVGFGEFVKQLITRRSIARLRHSFALKRSISLWAYDVGASAHIRICVNIIRLTAALSHHELIGGQTVEQRAFLGVSAFLTVKPDAVNKLLGAVWPATWAAPSPTASAVTVITNAARKPALATP
jgi:hypothetical protein